MKKIMVNDRYGLMQAVLEGKKTMARRIIPIDLYNQTDLKASEGRLTNESTAENYQFREGRDVGGQRGKDAGETGSQVNK